MNKNSIAPCIWINPESVKASEAARFYCDLFDDAQVTAESAVVTEIRLSGHPFIFLNGGPQYRPNPSISFYYICQTEAEFDKLWSALQKEGRVMMPADHYPWSEKYGWLQDRFGVSWQLALGKLEDVGQKITPCFLFVGEQYGRCEEAIQHYSSVFKNYELDGILRYEDNETPDKEGLVKHAQFSLNGQKFMAMESAAQHDFTFDEGISLTIYCENQEEIDHYWEKLTQGGSESMCGWLRDKYGVAWQVIPTILGKIMSDPDKAQKASQAFMEMKKIDIEQLVQASL